jgi:pimeloyl-ACP methyl ester carboxylesterase
MNELPPLPSGVTCELVAPSDPELRTGWGLPLVRGAWFCPKSGSPRIAFIAAHYNLDFSQHYLGPILAQRGFGFLGWNTRYCGREAYFLFDRALVDLGLGVRWLRQRGTEVVVLLGNSGGGSLLAAYQAQTQAAVVRPAAGLSLAAGIEGLEPGDLYVSLAAHPGRAEVLTNWLDPSVTDEADPTSTDPALDMYDPGNGPPYSPEFAQRYRTGQRARNRRITDWCKQELARVQAAGSPDRLFTLQRTWADLRFLDPGLDPSDRPTPACYQGDPHKANRGIEGLGCLSTLRTWLAMWSLEDSQCHAGDCLKEIRLPSLVIQARADAGVFPSDARAIFDGLAAEDKRLVEVPGDHYFQHPSGSRNDVAELIASWVGDRVDTP